HREDSLPLQVDIEERKVDRLRQRQARRCVELCRRADDIATELFQQVDQLESHGGIVLGEKHPHPLKLPCPCERLRRGGRDDQVRTTGDVTRRNADHGFQAFFLPPRLELPAELAFYRRPDQGRAEAASRRCLDLAAGGLAPQELQ